MRPIPPAYVPAPAPLHQRQKASTSSYAQATRAALPMAPDTRAGLPQTAPPLPPRNFKLKPATINKTLELGVTEIPADVGLAQAPTIFPQPAPVTKLPSKATPSGSLKKLPLQL